MRQVSAKKANEIYISMIIRHCYPYCVILDKEKETFAFRNRNYLFLHGYQEDRHMSWHPLNPMNYKKLQAFLENNINIYIQPYGERFLEYYLYNDGNPPMGKKSDYYLYRKLIENIVGIIDDKEITNILSSEERGFDFGKHCDGEYFPDDPNDPIVNVYDAAIREAEEKYIFGRQYL